MLARARRMASLLEQERPNIFTQTVANILPAKQVQIEISYVETLKYDKGVYEFSFPMVVGPRYIPGLGDGHAGRRLGPRYRPRSRRLPHQAAPAPPATRAGHDISVHVPLDAGVPIEPRIAHSRCGDRRGRSRAAVVKLRDEATIPNEDFILHQTSPAIKSTTPCSSTHAAGSSP